MLPDKSADEIFAVDDIGKELVEVPEWGCSVLVYGSTGKERDDFDARSLIARGKNQEANLRNLRARMVALCVRNRDGTRKFTDEQVERLGDKSSKALDRICETARRLSSITEKDIQDLTKNSESSPSGGSSSDSPSH
ncbi:MAG: hypothetical protein ACREJC_00055 [Tepidisphaeraceae bacterium]